MAVIALGQRRIAGDVEEEKGRATRGGLAKRRRTWRVLVLSAGELGVAESLWGRPCADSG
ncbi:MAG: hypothetical protein WCO86_18345 [Planctomycetota bacterium]